MTMFKNLVHRQHSLSKISKLPCLFRFDELLCMKAYEGDPDFRWCTNRTCSAGQIVEGGGMFSFAFYELTLTLEESSHFTCPSCQCKSCFHCRTPVHPFLTCKENLSIFHNQQFAADEPSGRWLKAYTKPCFCGRWIQKMDGCDHVKCPPRPMGCGDEWCWMCGAKYEDIRKKGNTAHKGDCPHFA